MIEIGLEKEFFILNDGNPFLVPDSLPKDECGWLAEARGHHFKSPVDAVFSLKADVWRIEQKLKKYNEKSASALVLSDQPIMKVSRDVRQAALRRSGKGMISYQNFYGHIRHRNAITEGTAAVHVTFSNNQDTFCACGKKVSTCNKNFDWVSMFRKLDKAFAEEIKASKRNPGFYEIKPSGMVEYRSLPANVDLDKLIGVLQGCKELA